MVVTGIGPVTLAGVGVDAFWSGLLAPPMPPEKRDLHVDLAELAPFHIATVPPDQECVTKFNDFLQTNEFAGYRDLGYALAAIDLAVQDAELEYDKQSNRIGVMQAFEAPGMERAVAEMYRQFSQIEPANKPPQLYETLAPLFYNAQPFLYVHAISKAFQFHGLSTSVHNACSTGTFAVEMAAQQIRNGHADAMIVVGAEAFETAVRIEWFRRLDLYNADGRMFPFDPAGSGFFVGEGAAVIVLESESAARARGRTPYAEYAGGAFSQQSWKHALPDVRSMRLRDVITSAMERGRLSPSDIDLVIPHGAATPISDGYEASCLDAALAGAATDAVATALKPCFGHMLATSNLIEIAAALLSMKHGSVPATPKATPDSTHSLPVPLVAERTERPVNAFMKLATGFTGHDAASIWCRA